MNMHTCIYIYRSHIYQKIYTYVYIYVYKYIFIFIYIHMYIYINMYTYIYLCAKQINVEICISIYA